MGARRMTLAAVEKHCASKAESVLTMPFGPHVHVYKTAGKMFALCGHLDEMETISLKCDPERSAMLRLTFPAITAGYHLHKEHWNTIRLDGTVPAGLIRQLIDHAYDVIRSSKPKRRRPLKPRPRKR
jgi:predicted DNA-binding protein (MmcQ/YjbR family)